MAREVELLSKPRVEQCLGPCGGEGKEHVCNCRAQTYASASTSDYMPARLVANAGRSMRAAALAAVTLDSLGTPELIAG